VCLQDTTLLDIGDQTPESLRAESIVLLPIGSSQQYGPKWHAAEAHFIKS
jgi:hypothetical protein